MILLAGANGCEQDLDHDVYTVAQGDCRDNPKEDPQVCASSLCASCADEACRSCARCINPGAEEYPDWIDSNCSGFADEPPIGFEREGSSMQGFASAVDWYDDYVYVAAGAVLQVYDTTVSPPKLTDEIEFRDWVRQMDVERAMLFVAARGDGVIALDLRDPAHPRPAGHFWGTFSADDSPTGVEALFHGVDALWDEQEQTMLVAVANANAVPANRGGIDAVVFNYDAANEKFNLLQAFDASVRSETRTQVPLCVGLAESGRSLYIGYGWPGISFAPPFFDPYGELVYVLRDGSAAPLHKTDIGAVMDLKARDSHAFTALTRACLSEQECGILSRFSPRDNELTEAPVLSRAGGGPGGAVDLDGDLLCFGTLSVGRYEGGSNVWAFTGLDSLDADPPSPPAVAGAAGTLDWIFQVACRDAGTDSRVFVADEWGGLEMWRVSDGVLTLDLWSDRVATGMFSLGMWNAGTKIYSIKEGAGLWTVDAQDLSREQAAVEWINPDDPGCSERCETYRAPPHDDEKGCCPPKTGAWPYQPAVFVAAGTSSQGRIAVLAQDRNTAVPGDGYFMLFKEDSSAGAHTHQCIYSESWPGRAGCGIVVREHDSFLFVSADVENPSPPNALRLYRHQADPSGTADTVEFLGEIEMPLEPQQKDDLWAIVDVAVYGSRLFVAEAHQPLLSVPDSGRICVFQWREDAAAPDQEPAVLLPAVYLGSFCTTAGTGFIPNRLLVDESRDRLVVGCSARYVPPVHQGALLFYDAISECLENAAGCFDATSQVYIETKRTDHAPAAALRVLNTYPNISDIAVVGDVMYVADFDNGLYKYALDSTGNPGITGFYPAHRGTAREPVTPHLVMSPEGVIPLFHPVSIGVLPSGGRIVVQEYMSGRVTILRDLQK